MPIRHAFAILNRILPAEEASAHCDIPCGIYDPHLAQVAALTVVRMNQLIEALEAPGGGGGPPSKQDRDKYVNALSMDMPRAFGCATAREATRCRTTC